MKSTTTTLGLLLLSYFPAIIATFTLSNPAWVSSPPYPCNLPEP